jgi:tetratricopeptide (TPR) repeat protein
MVGCLDDAALLELIHGQLPPASMAGVDAHLDACDSCRELVALAARGSDGRHAPAADELRAGDAVDRYIVLGRLGGGAMGVVYAAHDGELDRKVALKLLRPELAAGSVASGTRVLREAKAMARLQHPNVVTVHDVGTTGDRVFVAMELVAGPTLRVWAHGRPWRERLACVVAAGRGLAAAHAAGVVHRDVKPDNIIVDEHGRPRIGDFGLARAGESAGAGAGAPGAASSGGALAGGLTQTGAVIGTPMYMAPEQLRGEAATMGSDQFGLAVTAWEILFGARPFAGRDTDELARAIVRGPAEPERRGVPVAIERALRRGLEAEPSRRWDSVAALVDAIDWHPPRRWRWAVPVAGAGAAAAAVATMLVLGPAGAPADPCRTAAAALDEAWTPAVAGELRTKLAAAYDRSSVTSLDAYATRWRDARMNVCRAGRVRGAESEALVDVRAACLDRGRAELAALVAELRAADAQRLGGAAEAIAALTDPGECATSGALALLAPVPPAQRAAVAEVERGAAELRARLATSARVDPAGGAALVTAAAATGHAPTLAAAHVVHAELLRRAGDAVAADVAARAAVVAAEIGHDDLGAARAWIARVGAAGDRRDLGAVDEWAHLAGAAVTRAGDPPTLAARLANNVGLLAMNRGELARAQRELERALAMRRQLAVARGGGGDDLDVAQSLSALGHVARLRGDLDGALALFAQATEIKQQLLDAGHPEVAREHHNLAGVLRLMGRLDEAEARYELALQQRRAALGDEHPDVAITRNSLALVAIERGDLDRAARELGEARRIFAAAGHGELPIVLANLGLLANRRGNWKEAAAALAEAVRLYREVLPARHERIARALLDASDAAAGLRDPARALSLLTEARAAIPTEAGDRFVREADERESALTKPPRRPRPLPRSPPPPSPPRPTIGKHGTKPGESLGSGPATVPQNLGTYGSSQGWD